MLRFAQSLGALHAQQEAAEEPDAQMKTILTQQQQQQLEAYREQSES